MAHSKAPRSDALFSEPEYETKRGNFLRKDFNEDPEAVDLTILLEDVMQVRKDVPLEVVTNMFRKLVSGRQSSLRCNELNLS